MNPQRSRAVGAFIAALALLMGACGNDDASDTSNPASTEAAAPDMDPIDEPGQASEATAESANGDDIDDDAAPPAEDFGTVTVNGATTEFASADFLICETVNPAFADTINIIVPLDGDPAELRIAGDLPDEVSAEVGQLPDRIAIEGIDVSRDGRTVSGSVDADGTMIEFSFTC